MAELGGKRWGIKSRKLMYSQKTVAGSISFAFSALLISIAWGIISHLTLQQIFIFSITTTLVATTAEMISTRGLDNITVPLVTLACLLFST